jgi:hypothetical protein
MTNTQLSAILDSLKRGKRLILTNKDNEAVKNGIDELADKKLKDFFFDQYTSLLHSKTEVKVYCNKTFEEWKHAQ